uniref:Uncharacterized protein n=1 Tax=Anguilla anguilla TaxID=7936 RepID=A0A0E9V357_ANGAN
MTSPQKVFEEISGESPGSGPK